MVKTLREIAEDALENAFETAKCHKHGRRLIMKKGGKNNETIFSFKRYECSFNAYIDDDCVCYYILPRRVNLSDKWFAAIYVWFDKIPCKEHSKFRNTMVADFRALFQSIFETPFAWEDADWEKDKIAYFLTDSLWLNKQQLAPLALEYPNQTMNGGVLPLSSLIKLQDGYNHVLGCEPSEEARCLTFGTSASDSADLKLMDDATKYE